MIRVFIGHDDNETVARHVLAHSIERHCGQPVSITALRLSQLPMTRERDERQSTDFAFSRFLVPWLCNYKGIGIFMDCDMLCRADLSTLIDGVDNRYAVQVVKHDYAPRPEDKFLGQRQSIYAKKNWSSVMVFNNGNCHALDPEYVNNASGLELHQFKWAGDAQVGSLEPAWNHLVGEYAPNPDAKLVHYTLGTPCFAKYANCEYAQEWRDELTDLLHYNRRGEFNREDRQVA